MRRRASRSSALALLVSSRLTLVAPTANVHPLEQRPRLRDACRPSPLVIEFSIKATAGTRSRGPQGSMCRDGNVVSAKLNFVLADFTINNPDPTEP